MPYGRRLSAPSCLRSSHLALSPSESESWQSGEKMTVHAAPLQEEVPLWSLAQEQYFATPSAWYTQCHEALGIMYDRAYNVYLVLDPHWLRTSSGTQRGV